MEWLNKKVMLGIFGVVAVIAIVLVVVGVTTHTEAGLLKICWQDSKAYYQQDIENRDKQGECANPVKAKWSKERLPLEIVPSSDLGNLKNKHIDRTKSAIKLVNGQLGFKAVKYKAEAPGDVYVEWDHAYNQGSSQPGDCRHYLESGKMYGLIKMRAVGGNRYSYRILVHELGHCALGLAHDDFEGSIMYSPVPDDSMEDKMRFTRFSDHDVELLQNLYE